MNAPSGIEPTPEQLAQRSQSGCLESFEQLVLRYEDQIFNFLRQFTRNQQDAEDLTQETFVKAYRSLPRYTPSLAFAPWLFVIARRTAASHFRTVDHFEELPADSETAEADPATALQHADEQRFLWKLVRTLKPKQAEAVWLRYAEGFSVAEIALIMRANRVYVKVMLQRARSILSRLLTARGMGPVGLQDQSNEAPRTVHISTESKAIL
jgi:RNA polymerase sigma-70 factor (ECF subfamily)